MSADGFLTLARAEHTGTPRDEGAKARASSVRVVLLASGRVGTAVLGGRVAPKQPGFVRGGNALGMAELAGGLRVVERGYGHERDLELVLDVYEGIVSRIGDAGNAASPARYSTARKVDVLARSVRWVHSAAEA